MLNTYKYQYETTLLITLRIAIRDAGGGSLEAIWILKVLLWAPLGEKIEATSTEESIFQISVNRAPVQTGSHFQLLPGKSKLRKVAPWVALTVQYSMECHASNTT